MMVKDDSRTNKKCGSFTMVPFGKPFHFFLKSQIENIYIFLYHINHFLLLFKQKIH
jgi:hypothetical protein